MITTITNASTTAVVIERKTKILRITLALTVLSFVIFLITLTSSNWVIITYPANTFPTRQNITVARSTYGIIWECLYGRATTTSINGKYE